MKLSKKDLQTKRNRNNDINYTREVTDLRNFEDYNFLKTVSECKNGYIDAYKEIIKNDIEKQNEEKRYFDEHFPSLAVARFF